MYTVYFIKNILINTKTSHARKKFTIKKTRFKLVFKTFFKACITQRMWVIIRLVFVIIRQ